MGICGTNEVSRKDQHSNFKNRESLNQKVYKEVTGNQPDLQPGFLFEIDESVVDIGLGWDFKGGETFDLDGSVIAYDSQFNVLETVFFSKTQGFNGLIFHHGDNLTGEGAGDDEQITIQLRLLPLNVAYMSVQVNSYKENSISKARSAYIRLYSGSKKLGKYILNKTKDCLCLVLGLFQKDLNTGTWYFRTMIDPLPGNVVTKSTPLITEIVKTYSLGKKSDGLSVNHPLEGEAVFNPGEWFKVLSQNIYIGMGWDFAGNQIFDLDSSLITFNSSNRPVEMIYYKNSHSANGSIIHMGDNTSGVGNGDDEIISINLSGIHNEIHTIALLVNSFKGNSIKSAQSGFVRLFNESIPIGCYLLQEVMDTTGLLLGMFKKNKNNEWYFQILITPVKGKSCEESQNEVVNIVSQLKQIEGS